MEYRDFLKRLDDGSCPAEEWQELFAGYEINQLLGMVRYFTGRESLMAAWELKRRIRQRNNYMPDDQFKEQMKAVARDVVGQIMDDNEIDQTEKEKKLKELEQQIDELTKESPNASS